MREWMRTLAFLGTAAVFLLLVVVSAPGRPDPEAFREEGTLFFPEFKNPTHASSIEVISYDEGTSTVDPFKVERRAGRWVIPSHENYPAEAEDRLVKVAAGVMALKRDSLRSDRKEDHAKLGVLDPMDESAGVDGAGMRVILRSESDRVLADFILGRKVENREGFHFLRLPDQKRTYAVKVGIELSSRFHDWIEPDLLKLEKSKIRRIRIDLHTVDEVRRMIQPGEILVLNKDESGFWSLEGLKEDEEFVRTKLDNLLSALDDLTIVDVVRKPAGITKDLKQAEGIEVTREKFILLMRRGFILTQEGHLFSNKGELRVWTDEGTEYVLRFGELAPGGEEKEERRYLFIGVRFQADMIPKPKDDDPKKQEEKMKKWKEEVEKGEKKAKELRDRYADWYYIIPGEAFKKTRLTRADLTKKKPGSEKKDGEKKDEEKKDEPKGDDPKKDKPEDEDPKKEEPKGDDPKKGDGSKSDPEKPKKDGDS